MFHVVACERFENRFANGEIEFGLADLPHEAVKMFYHAQEHILCSTWWLVNDLKLDLQMGRFGFGLADLPLI